MLQLISRSFTLHTRLRPQSYFGRCLRAPQRALRQSAPFLLLLLLWLLALPAAAQYPFTVGSGRDAGGALQPFNSNAYNIRLTHFAGPPAGGPQTGGPPAPDPGTLIGQPAKVVRPWVDTLSGGLFNWQDARALQGVNWISYAASPSGQAYGQSYVGTYTYTFTFNLPPPQATLLQTLLVSDNVGELYLNNVKIFQSEGNSFQIGFAQLLGPVSAPINIGQNIFTIKVTNGDDGANYNPTGFALKAIFCAPASVSSLALTPSDVVGGIPVSQQSVIGEVTLSIPALDAGQVITLGSNNPAASVPQSVVVPAGQRTATFPITTRRVTATTTATISASYRGGQTSTATLTIRPPAAMAMSSAPRGATPLVDRRRSPLRRAGDTVRKPVRGPGANGGPDTDTTGLVTTPLASSNPDLNSLVRRLLGPGVAGFSNVRFTGVADAAGTFHGGTGIIGIEDGVILSSGNINNVVGPNQSDGITAINGSENDGDADLDALIPGYSTQDATVLEFDFVPTGNTLSWQYVFASDEYNEYVGSIFNDVFGFFVNGRNVALLPDGVTTVSINNINNGYQYNNTNWPPTNPLFYRNNDYSDFSSLSLPFPFNTEMDGLTTVLTVTTSVNPGQVNRIKLAIADAGDDTLDSNVFLQAGSFRTGNSRIIYTRQDRDDTYSAFSVTAPQTVGAAAPEATFDLTGITGTVVAAHIRRAGQIFRGPGSGFDLEWGIRSRVRHEITNAQIGPTSFGPLQPSVQNLDNPHNYDRAWHLPAEFYTDVQGQIGQVYRVDLVDRVSSACGTYTLADTPQQGWPADKNVLSFLIAPNGNPEIPQGGGLDITIPDNETPAYGTWDIVLDGQIVASSGNPRGWGVRPDDTVYQGMIVAVPRDAAVARGYTVRLAGSPARSGVFDVIPLGGVSGAPTLHSLTFNPNPVRGGGTAVGTLTLTAPAPRGGVTVGLSSDNPAVAAVGAVTVTAGSASATFEVETNGVSAPTPVGITASYNGTLRAVLLVLDPGGGPPAAPQNLTAAGGDGHVALNWEDVPGATSYTVKRSLTRGGPHALLFAGLTSTSYVDRAVSNGTTYHYVVTASNAYGESGPSNEAGATPTAGTVATPTISPNGGTFQGSVRVSLACATPGAAIHYATNGDTPDESSPRYGAPLTLLPNSAPITLKARAFKVGFAPSQTASAPFVVQPVSGPSSSPIGCGQTVTNGTLSTNDGFSQIQGNNNYRADRYTLSGMTVGRRITVSLQSDDFDAYLYLIGPDGAVVAENDDSNNSLNAQIVFTVPQNGTYTIEATSYEPGETGAYTLSVNCADAGNTPPSVAITDPGDNAQIVAGSNLEITATASDPDGTVTKVEFFQGTTKIGEATSEPYTVVWLGVPVGAYTLRATATDDQGAKTTSAPIRVTATTGLSIRPIGCNESVADSLTTIDGFSTIRGSNNHRADRYQFNANVGDRIVVTQRSGVFDSYLYVTSPTGLRREDDDGNGAPNAQIVFTVEPGEEGTYTIEATSYSAGETGAYTLSLRCNGTATIGPELAVSVNGASVPHEGTFSFGSTPLEVPVTKTFTLTNTGDSDLAITSVSGNGDFALTQAPQSPILPGSATTLSLRFNATYAASSSGVLSIQSNGTLSPYTIYLEAVATSSTPGSITLTDFTLDPASVAGGGITNATVTLSEAAPQGGTSVGLSSDNGPVVPVPATVRVPQGRNTYTFPIPTRPSATQTDVLLRATLGGDNRDATLTVTPTGAAPTVELTAPDDGASYTAPATINLAATASDSDGTIAKVEFFANGAKIGEDTSAPYTFTWAGVEEGGYALEAKATDNSGLSATSASRTITVNAMPQLTPAPTISPSNTTHSGRVQVSLSHPASEVMLFYATGPDPAATPDPTPASTRYTGPFYLPRGTTVVKARAFKVGFRPSPVASRTYTVNNNGSGLPSVEIKTPADGSTITGPTDVTGTVNSGALAYWELSYRLLEIGAPAIRFASGINTVSAGPLGRLDTTLLLNGIYEITLVAYDQAGNSNRDTSTVVVEGNQKVGHFTLSYVDLTLPVAGIPIQVTRTYDSRDKRVGDFGVGWTLSMSNVRVQKSGAIGVGWKQNKNGINYEVTDSDPGMRPHRVTITFPDGEVYRFKPVLNPSASGFFPVQGGRVTFQPLPGTRGTLTAADEAGEPLSDDVYIDAASGGGGYVGPIELLDWGTDEPYDTDYFLLTLRDGRQFHLSVDAGLMRVVDRNDNTLWFDANGIRSSGGKSVTFVRNGNRILQIQDPNGRQLVYGYNGSGDLTSFTDREGNRTTYTYDFAHNLTGIQDPRGRLPVRNYYTADGRLDYSLDANGKRIDYNYDVNARLQTIVDRLNRQTLIAYDARGNVTRTTKSLIEEGGRLISTSSDYADPNNPDKPTRVTDALGKTTVYEYNPQGDLLKVIDPLLSETRYAYNGRGQVTRVVDAEGKETANEYDPVRGDLLRSRDALGNITEFNYNRDGTVNWSKDAKNNVTGYTYFPDGQPQTVRDALGNVTEFAYDPNGNKTGERRVRTNPNNGQPQVVLTQYEYDNEDRLIRTVAPDGSSTRTQYNSIGKVDFSEDGRGRVTRYDYDDLGQRTATHAPSGTTGALYDDNGRPTISIDLSGRRTHTDYDSLGRPYQVRYLDPNGEPFRDEFNNPIVTRTEYDDNGRVRAQTDERGHATRTEYDDAGRQTFVRDALNNVTAYQYDKNGRQNWMRDALGRVTTTVYDDLGRVTEVHTPTGVVSTEYDKLGQRTRQTDASGRPTSFDYDALGRLKTVTNGLGKTTTYEYNEVGQRTRQTDALGRITHFAYDVRGRLQRRTLPLGQFEEMDYYPDGKLWHKRDFNNRVTTYVYDAAGRLQTKSSTTGESVTFDYWPDGQKSTAARTTPAGDTVTTNFGYDSRGRLWWVSGPTGTITYGYDAANNRTRLQTPSGVTTYAFDPLGRLAQVVHPNGSGTSAYRYDKVGNKESVLRPGGLRTDYQYDEGNRLRAVLHSGAPNLPAFTYTLDGAGRRLQVSETGPTPKTTAYTYDGAGQLEREDSGPGDWAAYHYDPVGNRHTKSGPAGITHSRYDPNDRLVRVEPPGAAASVYGYDDNGNLTQRDAMTLVYDFENHLVSAGADTFRYDGEGHRLGKTDGAGTTSYLVDVNTPYAQVVEESGPAGVARLDYGDELLRLDRDGTYYYLYDGLGSTRALVKDGALTDAYRYDAFGVPSLLTGSTANAFLFNGQQYDASTGLYYLRARYYAPGQGRFLSQDPFAGDVQRPISLHRYLYASNDPVNRIDPGGMSDLAQVSFTSGLGQYLQGIGAIGSVSAQRFIYGKIGVAIARTLLGVYAASIGVGTVGVVSSSAPSDEPQEEDGNLVVYHYTNSPASSFVGGMRPTRHGHISYVTKFGQMSGQVAGSYLAPTYFDPLTPPGKLPIPPFVYKVLVPKNDSYYRLLKIDWPREGILPNGSPPGSVIGPFAVPRKWGTGADDATVLTLEPTLTIVTEDP